MNDPLAPAPDQNTPGLRLAVLLGSILLVVLGLSLALVARDNARRAKLEVVVESSPLNDTTYLSIPQPPPTEPFPAVARLRGQPLVAEDYRLRERREVNLQPVEKDEATGLTIYQEDAKSKDADDLPNYYLKAGPGKFIKVRPVNAKK